MAKSAAMAIKRCGNSRSHRPAADAYVSLADLAAMVEDDEDFVVRGAKTGENITQFIRGPGNDG